MESPEPCIPKRPALDYVLGASELSGLCARLGFSPPIWHWTEMFNARIESSIDEASLEGEWSRRRGEADTGDGIALVTDPAALRAVLDEAEERFQDWANRAENREDFDGVIQLVRSIRELLVGRKPVRASLILDLTGRMSYSRNWERLPESVYERKRTLDHVSQNLGRAMKREKGLTGEDMAPHLFAEAAQVYVANDWMHDRWLAKLLTREMLSNVRSSVAKSANRARRWNFGCMAVACVVVTAGVLMAAAAVKAVGVLIAVAGAVALVVDALRICDQGKLDRIIDEVQGECFAGGVVAERLERLNSPRLPIPSILVELLRTQRC
jgi:hypothetical protein